MPWSRTSRQSRGYGREWDRLRKEILERDRHLCQCTTCKREDRTTVATEVDHIVSKARAKRLGWTDKMIDDPSNLQAINTDCHKRKTLEETGRSIRPTIGPDGWLQRPGG